MVNLNNEIFPFFRIKKMKKYLFNPLSFFLIIVSIENSVYSLSNYQIIQRCHRDSKKSTCIKNLKLKKLNLLQGNKIEIPVIPFKN